MNSKPLVLLDTSIQIERLLGAASQRRVIEQRLVTADARFVTSAYVFMEFQRTVLADYVRIYNTLLQYPTWEETAQILRSGPLSYKPRAMGRSLQILTQIMTLSQMNNDNALGLLRTIVKHELPNRFWQHVEPLSDPIICDLVSAGVKLQADNRCRIADSCRKDLAACHLPDFLADHRAELQTVANYLAAHPQAIKEQARLERLLGMVIDDPRVVLGQSSCWPLGDLIIALQALPDAHIWTIDADFLPIAQALGLTLYSPTFTK